MQGGISDENRRGRTMGFDSQHYTSGAMQANHKLYDLGQVTLKLKDLVSFSVGIIVPIPSSPSIPATLHSIRM